MLVYFPAEEMEIELTPSVNLSVRFTEYRKWTEVKLYMAVF